MVSKVTLILFMASTFMGKTLGTDVPVLIWSNSASDLSQYLEPVSAASKLTENNFKEDYIEKLFDQKFVDDISDVVIFLQDKLSVEDFTKYGNAYGSQSTPTAYKYLKSLVTGSDANSVFLPSVTNAGETLQQTADSYDIDSEGNAWQKVTLKSGHYLLDGVRFINGGKRVIVVYLPERSEDVEESLRTNDGIVERVVSKLEAENQQYVAVFTGRKPSHVMQYVVTARHDRLRREAGDDSVVVSAAEGGNTTIIYINCTGSAASSTLFYVKKIMFNVLTSASDGGSEGLEKSVPLKSEKIQKGDESRCLNKTAGINTALLQLEYDDEGSGEKVKLTMMLELTVYPGGEWRVSTFNLSYDCQLLVNDNKTTIRLQKDDDRLLVGDWSAPRGYSYHCDSTGNLAGRRVTNTNDTQADDDTRAYGKEKVVRRAALQFVGLQLQPGVSGERFGRGYDCQVFFTAPILMGIVVGAILIFIFMYGMAMMMSLSTMDRFDDPKGKTITVPQTD